MTENRDPELIVREIKRKTRRKLSAEEKIGIVLEGLRGALACGPAMTTPRDHMPKKKDRPHDLSIFGSFFPPETRLREWDGKGKTP